MNLAFALLAFAALEINLHAADNPRLLTQPEQDKWFKEFTAAADPADADHHHWTWYPEQFFRAEIELNKDTITFRVTNTGPTDQIIADLLFNPKYLKSMINVQVFSGAMRPDGLGIASDIFQLDGIGVPGTDEELFTVQLRKIAPHETLQAAFNLIEALKQVNNPKLAAYLAKESIHFCLIFPMERYFLGSKERGTIEFHSPDLIYKLR